MIPYGRQWISDDDVAAVTESLRSDFLTTGPAVTAFEKQLCAVTGAKYTVACSNGTTALHLACMALGIKNGDLGVTSPNTFLASANCIEYCGGRTDFVDIDPATLCMSPEKLEEYCSTVAVPKIVIPVDFAGVPADLPAIWLLAKKYGFNVIEDAAHSLGSTYEFDGKTINCASCTHSELAILSFHPVKTITTGEGGAITTNDDALAARLRLFRSHGMTKDPAVLQRQDGPWYYEMHELGFNYRLTDLQCALGSSQLKKLGDFKTRRHEIVTKYNAAFANIPGVIRPSWPGNTSPCFHLYPVQFSQGSATRRRIYDQLAACGINCQVHYYPVHLQPYYTQKYGYSEGKCSAAEEYYSRCLSLPLFPAMTDDEVERVIEEVRRVTRG